MSKDPTSVGQIGDRLRQTRIALGFDKQQGRFAERAGCAVNAYNQWERGKRRLDVGAAIKIAATYSLTLDWIYRGIPSGLSADLVGRLTQTKP